MATWALKFLSSGLIVTSIWAQSPERPSLITTPQVISESQKPLSDGGLPHQSLTTTFRGRELSYFVINGMAVHAGDMVLGSAEDIGSWPAKQRSNKARPLSEPVRRDLSSVESDFLWPDGMIPYVIDTDVSSEQRQSILEAIKSWNDKTVITIEARTTELNYVRFMNTANGSCKANTGMSGGEQMVYMPLDNGCSTTTLVHEIGHAVGLWHEHERMDRDEYIMLIEENIDKNAEDQLSSESPGGGPYDYASTMHYGHFLASWNGNVVFETIPPGMRIPSADLSPGDIDGVARLYGMPPTTTSVTTNPPGLEIVVDGVRVTTPASFEWVAESTHTLEAPVSQMMDESRYLFGRWNNGGKVRLWNVTASPDTTWLEANFIVQHRVSTAVYPAETGNVTISPHSPDSYYTLRTPVQATATPAPGSEYRFWAWNKANSDGHASNPSTGSIVGPEIEFEALFTTRPVFRIESNIGAFWLKVADETFVQAPYVLISKDSAYTFQLGMNEVGLTPRSSLEQHRFESWSDGGAISHDVTVPTEGGVITANIVSEFPLFTSVAIPDSGTVIVNPASEDDGYYREGTPALITAQPASGWEFVRWLGDIDSRDTSTTIQMDRSMYVRAEFSQTQKLEPSEAHPVVLLPTDTGMGPHAYHGSLGFRIEPPSDASEIRISFTSDSEVDIDLFVNQGSDISHYAHVDFNSTSLSSSETIIISSDSSPPLDATSVYYIGFLAYGMFSKVEGTLLAEIDYGPSLCLSAHASPRALTFVSSPQSDPASQVIRLTNDGSGTLQYVIESDQTWLSAYPSNGSIASGATADLAVSTVSAGLQSDSHLGNLTVKSSGQGIENPRELQNISVTLVVTPASSSQEMPANP